MPPSPEDESQSLSAAGFRDAYPPLVVITPPLGMALAVEHDRVAHLTTGRSFPLAELRSARVVGKRDSRGLMAVPIAWAVTLLSAIIPSCNQGHTQPSAMFLTLTMLLSLVVLVAYPFSRRPVLRLEGAERLDLFLDETDVRDAREFAAQLEAEAARARQRRAFDGTPSAKAPK